MICELPDRLESLGGLIFFTQGMIQMKKIIFTTLICTAPMFANATDMCARDNVMVLVFDPQVKCSSTGNNAAEWSWWAQMPYGRLAGDATCVSQTEVNQKQFSPGLSGVDANGENRIFCYCRISHPVISGWVQRAKHTTNTDCSKNCSLYCSIGDLSFCTNVNTRIQMFNSIGVSE